MEIGLAEILLIVAGLVSFLIVYLYRDDKDATEYKLAMVGGLIVGVAITAVAAMNYSRWSAFDNALIFLAGFALIIRPFRQTQIAIIAALVVMVATYYYTGTLTGNLEFLADGTPRIVATIVAGAFTYMILNFIEKLADILGKFLNLWPVLLVLGIVCLVEAVLIIFNGTSLFDYYQKYKLIEAVATTLIY